MRKLENNLSPLPFSILVFYGCTEFLEFLFYYFFYLSMLFRAQPVHIITILLFLALTVILLPDARHPGSLDRLLFLNPSRFICQREFDDWRFYVVQNSRRSL